MKAISALMILIAACLLMGQSVQAGDTSEGSIVKAGGGKLTLVDREGKNERSYEVASDAVITLDGKECKLDDLPRASWVTVTIDQRGDKSYASKIEAKRSKNP